MKNHKQINIVTGWIVFIISSVVYLMTMEPTASFWDCGEFISTAYKLEVGHPPGAPFFMILARFFTLFASEPAQVAKMVNSLSALASGATILFLFWSITHLARKLVTKDNAITPGQSLATIGSGLVGALAYTFSDTFWFSAVEGEVYASSSLFTAIVFWAILKWENVANERHSNKWIILIAYLMGLSIGIHLLNLLAIPAIALVYYFKKYETSRNGIIAAVGVSFVMLLSIMYGIIPGIVKVAAFFELTFVNSFGTPYNFGLLTYIVLLIASIVTGLYFTNSHRKTNLDWIYVAISILLMGIPFLANITVIGVIILGITVWLFYYLKENRVMLNTILLVATVIVMGYSSFAMIMIRSLADPPMDQNNPETLFGLQYYLNREQYGDRPLFYGQYYSAPVIDSKITRPIYTALDNKYKKTDDKFEYVYDEKFMTLFPRMYSHDQRHVTAYQQWGRIKGVKIKTRKSDGSQGVVIKPKFSENLRFFFRYQVNFMYLRYFYWNFVGRQNDIQGHGYSDDGSKDVLKGNWISGIKFIDEARLGPQDDIPDSIKNNKARNTYYFLPLILGLLGMYYQYKKQKRDFWIVLVLFFMTGLAIVLYLNQYPFQPRERDYAYAGSFYAFSIWIGLGVLLLIEFFNKILPHHVSSVSASLLCLVLVPGNMAKENWDDHDRSGCYTARDFAFNYLQSCKKNAVLFTNGDNDTFPLWYIQEVEGVRTDVRVCNLSYLGADWYIQQMQRKAYDSDPLPFTMTKEKYLQGNRDVVYFNERTKKSIDLQKEAMPWVVSDDLRFKVSRGNEVIHYFPSKNFKMVVDKEKIIENELLNPKYHDLMLDTMEWSINSEYIVKNQLMVLDLLAGNDWERPIYFAITVSSDNYVNLEKFFQICGLSYKIVPLTGKVENGIITNIDTDEMFENMVNKFRWGGIDKDGIYLNENNQRMLMNFRNNFAQLADALIIENKLDKAEQALDRSLEAIPQKNAPYNYVMIGYIDLYHKLNQTDKANEISDVLEKTLTEELDYYFKFKDDLFKSVFENIRLNLSVIQRLAEIANENQQEERVKRLSESFEKYYNIIKMTQL